MISNLNFKRLLRHRPECRPECRPERRQILGSRILRFALAVSTLAAVGCVTRHPQTPTQTETSAPEVEAESTKGRVDFLGLRRYLGLERQLEDLGYSERTFNSCDVGFGFSSNQDCRRLVLSVVQVRLQCRFSEGTVSTALGPADLSEIAGRQVRWELGGVSGTSRTDGEGYARVEGVFPKSPKRDRLRLAVGDQFLYVRAGDASRIVTPGPWCE